MKLDLSCLYLAKLFFFLAASGLCCCTLAFSSCGKWGYSLLWCAGFSLRWLLLLQSTGSRCTGLSSCGSRAPERRLSSCGTRAQLLRGMGDPPGPGLEPVFPALAGGFLTTAPPGKPTLLNFHEVFDNNILVATVTKFL